MSLIKPYEEFLFELRKEVKTAIKAYDDAILGHNDREILKARTYLEGLKFSLDFVDKINKEWYNEGIKPTLYMD